MQAPSERFRPTQTPTNRCQGWLSRKKRFPRAGEMMTLFVPLVVEILPLKAVQLVVAALLLVRKV